MCNWHKAYHQYSPVCNLPYGVTHPKLTWETKDGDTVKIDFCPMEHLTSEVTFDVDEMLRKQFDVLIDLDTEWTERDHRTAPPLGLLDHGTMDQVYRDRKRRNRILSYQWTAIDTATGQTAQTIILPDSTLRLGSGEVIVQACHDLGIAKTRLRQRGSDRKLLKVLLGWHWGGAEVGALSNWKRIMENEEVVSINGKVATLEPFKHSLCLDGSDNFGLCLVTMRDTALLMDDSKGISLEVLGEEFGLEKIDIAPYTKDRMDVLLAEDRALFIRYAMRDTEISLRWLCDTAKTQREVLNLNKLSITTGAASASGLQHFVGDMQTFEQRFSVKYNRRRGEWLPTKLRAPHEGMPIAAFMGGMNQSYNLNHVSGTIIDFDLAGAYTAAMGVIPGIDWSVAPAYVRESDCPDPATLTGLLSYTSLWFTFPEGTEFPCLPVHTNHGLIYPLSNEGDNDPTTVTGTELREALDMGVSVRIWSACTFEEDGLLVAEYIGKLAAIRKQYPSKVDPRNKAAKLALNSLYGKFGQGLTDRYTNAEIFSEGELSSKKKMKRCAITLPHAAATITGIVRAVLNVLVNEAATVGTVLSSTTDGFMLHTPEGTDVDAMLQTLIDRCTPHAAVQLLLEGRENTRQSRDGWLEIKRVSDNAQTLKTRMNAQWNHDGRLVNEARTGYPKNQGRPDYVGFNTLVRAADSHHTLWYHHSELNKIEDIVEGRATDITGYYTTTQVNLAPDWKRKFHVDKTSHPFQSMTEYFRYRRVVDCLKGAAFPEMVEYMTVRGTSSHTSAETAVRRDVLHRIALGYPGFKLPSGMSERKACLLLGVANNTLAKLKVERKPHQPLPKDHPEVLRIQGLLHLV